MKITGVVQDTQCNALENVMVEIWHADDDGVGGCFQDIFNHFIKPQELGPPRGHFPEQTRAILVVHPKKVDTAESHFCDLNFKITTGEGTRARRPFTLYTLAWGFLG